MTFYTKVTHFANKALDKVLNAWYAYGIKQREKGATKGQWGKEKNGCGEDETGTGSLWEGPSLSILQNALEWNDKEVTDNLEKRKMTAKIIVKAEGRKQLLSDKESITKGLLNMINNKMPRYKKAKARAKTESTNMREYDFFEKHFSYTIDIVNYHIENYERVYYTVDELMDIYKKNIIMAFAENKKILLTLANR